MITTAPAAPVLIIQQCRLTLNHKTISVVIIHQAENAGLLIQTGDADNRRSTKGRGGTISLPIGLSDANEGNCFGFTGLVGNDLGRHQRSQSLCLGWRRRLIYHPDH